MEARLHGQDSSEKALKKSSAHTLPISPNPSPLPRLVLAGTYSLRSVLGKGSFAVTWLAETHNRGNEKAQQLFAVKCVPYKYVKMMEREASVLSLFRTSRVIVNMEQFYSSVSLAGERQSVLVLELLEARPLCLMECTHESEHAFIDCPDRRSAFAKIALQLLTSIAELHSNDILHADIKPENIMFRPNSKYGIKLIDFGNAETEDDLQYYTNDFEIQSLAYRAPEVFLHDPLISHKIDIWSIGVVLAEIILKPNLSSLLNDKGHLVGDGNLPTILERIQSLIGDLKIYKSRVASDFADMIEERPPGYVAHVWSALESPNPDSMALSCFLQRLLAVDYKERSEAYEALQDDFLIDALFDRRWLTLISDRIINSPSLRTDSVPDQRVSGMRGFESESSAEDTASSTDVSIDDDILLV